VGFTIQRKRRRLENYIKRRQAKPPSPFLPPPFKQISKIITLEASGLRSLKQGLVFEKFSIPEKGSVINARAVGQRQGRRVGTRGVNLDFGEGD